MAGGDARLVVVTPGKARVMHPEWSEHGIGQEPIEADSRMEKVAFTFGWEEDGHPIPPGSTTIEITLHPEGDKTLVRLVHSGLPDDALGDHGNGWAHYLDRLALRATGGDPGPDKR
jgi:uncharacterized protein YndB with AHSA1/START domain